MRAAYPLKIDRPRTGSLHWSMRNDGIPPLLCQQQRPFRTPSVLPAVLGTLLITLGAQNALGGFLLAIVSGNEARFLESGSTPRA